MSPKVEGGLGIIVFRAHAMALKVRWVTKILQNDDL